MFPGMKMLATKIKLNTNARGIHRSVQHLFKTFQVIYSNTPDFGYSNGKQKSWAKLYPGWSRQYPIVIYSGTVEVIGMAPLQLEGYDKIVPGRLAIGNNGHTVSISLIQDSKNRQCNSYRPPTISGGLLKNVYEFEGLHFHWTKRNNRGCEHVIDNIRYPLEMHLVHRNIKYDCIEKALEHEDGLCVAAVFFDISEMPYKAFDTIIEHFIYIQNTNNYITLDCGLVLDTLLPTNTQNFYTYKGSLLSPPYNKSINWIIFSQPIYISFEQLSEFQLLQKNQDNEIFDNCRNIQPIEDKKVYARDPNIPFIPACDMPCPNIPITTNANVSCPHITSTVYDEKYFPVSTNDRFEPNKKIITHPTSSNKEYFNLTMNKKDENNSAATYNQMYFPVSCKDESESNKKLEPNSTYTNKEALDPALTKEEHHHSAAAYNEMYFPISTKSEHESNKKHESNLNSANKEAINSNLIKKEHLQSTENYNEMYYPVLPQDENASNKKIETNSTSTNKAELDPTLSKENQNSTTAYNEMYIPISSKAESASNKDPNSTSTNKETLHPNLAKEEHQHTTATCNEMYFPIPSKDERDSSQKVEPGSSSANKNVILKSTKKDATSNKKEFCNPIATNVLSTKTQDRGLMTTIRNMIKDALIKFFSK